MSAAFRTNATLSRLLHRHPITNLTRPPILCNQTHHSKSYFRLPDFIRKTRAYDHYPSLFSTPFSSSSSTTSSKTGLVGLYLGLIKSRPVLTKSITSALIYIAADLSSQVIIFFINLKPFLLSLCLVLEKMDTKKIHCS